MVPLTGHMSRPVPTSGELLAELSLLPLLVLSGGVVGLGLGLGLGVTVGSLLLSLVEEPLDLLELPLSLELLGLLWLPLPAELLDLPELSLPLDAESPLLDLAVLDVSLCVAGRCTGGLALRGAVSARAETGTSVGGASACSGLPPGTIMVCPTCNALSAVRLLGL